MKRFDLNNKSLIKGTVFWDTMPCSTLKVNWRFEGTYRLHLQGRRISRARNQRESFLLTTCFNAGFLLGLFFYPEDGGNMFLSNFDRLPTDNMTLYATTVRNSILQDSHNWISLKCYHEPQSCLFLVKASYILRRFQVGITGENKRHAISCSFLASVRIFTFFIYQWGAGIAQSV
jgi:hypothetical protein